MTHRFWPFDRRTAYILSAVLVPICVAVVVWLHRWNGKDETDVPPLALLLAVIVGLAPVLLVILSGVGSVEAAGVKLAFAAVQEVVTERGAVGARSLLANNLGTAPGQVQDSSGNTIIDSLREAVGNDVVVADLREGQAWWETRLLMLAAGAQRLGYPRAIVFTCATPNRPHTFIGWAAPGDLLRRLTETDVALGKAVEAAERDTLLWKLSQSKFDGYNRTLPWAAAGKQKEPYHGDGQNLPPHGQPAEQNMIEFPWPSPDAVNAPGVMGSDGFIPERLLLRQLQEVESADLPRWVTERRVTEIFRSVLHTDAVDREDGEERWVDTIVRSTADFFAVTSGRQFVNLVPRRAATNAVLLSVIGRSPR